MVAWAAKPAQLDAGVFTADLAAHTRPGRLAADPSAVLLALLLGLLQAPDHRPPPVELKTERR